MSPEKSIAILEKQREQIPALKGHRGADAEFSKWKRDTEVAIAKIFGSKSRNVEDFSAISFSLTMWVTGTPDSAWVEAKNRGLDKADAVLRSMIDEIRTYDVEDDEASAPSALSLIERICLKFHTVARQLRSRHDERAPLSIEDEYDVQDLLHALLKIHFDDIRPEEWTPSYAGSSSRLDFLLKDEKVVIEVKKTRKNLAAKLLGEQLLVDIARYERHPDCKLLICFIYDPEGRIGNPIGLERDLESHSGKLPVRVIIGPKA